jgi:hypothetical protein
MLVCSCLSPSVCSFARGWTDPSQGYKSLLRHCVRMCRPLLFREATVSFIDNSASRGVVGWLCLVRRDGTCRSQRTNHIMSCHAFLIPANQERNNPSKCKQLLGYRQTKPRETRRTLMCICMHLDMIMSNPLLSARPKPSSKAHTTRESHASTRQVWPSAAAEAKGFPEHHPILSRHNAAPSLTIINAPATIGHSLSIIKFPALTSHEALLRSYCLFHLSALFARLLTPPRQ